MQDPGASDQEQLIARLVARIAELEAKLYTKEFEAPVIPDPTTADRPDDAKSAKGTPRDAAVFSKPAQPEAGKPKEGFFSALKKRLTDLSTEDPSRPPAELKYQPHNYSFNSGNKPAALQGKQKRQSSFGGGAAPAPAAATATTQDDHQQQPDQQADPSKPQGEVGTGPPSAPDSRPASRPCTSGGAEEASTSLPAQPGPDHDALQQHSAKVAPQTQVLQKGSQPEPEYSEPFSEWLSSIFKRDKNQTAEKDKEKEKQKPRAKADTATQRVVGEAFNDRSFDAQSEPPTPSRSSANGMPDGSYYRYVFDPVDVQAEMEVTQRVRKAAAEALMEAQEKLRAAEEAQARLQQQLEEALGMEQEVERLKAENEQALALRKQLEDEVMEVRGSLGSTREQAAALQAEMEGMREASAIWKSSSSSEAEKLKQENTLLRSQMQTRLNELQSARSRLSDMDTERQKQARDNEELQAKVKWLQTINMQLETSAMQLEALRKASAEWQEKFLKERNVRRKLHEQLQTLKGNIRVMCRTRPPQEGQRSIVAYPLEGLLAISPPDRRPQEFEFDHVFPPEATQEQVFEEVSPLIRSCADGYNVCIFAYGQTGSGKTFTMEGPPDQPGINTRALQELFRIAAEEGQDVTGLRIRVSMMEIYNEVVHDLLQPPGEAGRVLEVSGLGAGELPPGHERVPGLTWRDVSCLEDVKQTFKEGSKNRATASTAMNASSSRSHALLSVRVSMTHPDGRQSSGMIHLVDLAGSERVDKSEVTGQQLKEAQSINKSLSALGDVIAALQRRSPHIPFRNSKLTQVLQDSLSGTSKVMLVCNLSPEPTSASETVSSLNFASRAAQVELGQARRVSAHDRAGGSSSGTGAGPAERVPSGSATPPVASPALMKARDANSIKVSRSSPSIYK